MAKHLVTFADTRMRRSLLRVLKQAKTFNLFNAIHLFDETKLPCYFKESFKEKLVFGSRGYGYWAWKPIILSQVLDELHDGDSMLYIDVGCHLNIHGKNRLIEYFEILEKTDNGVLGFQANPPNISNSALKYDGRKLFEQPNYRWIKGDLFDYFNARNNHYITNSEAIGAGIIFLKKCSAAVEIVEEWRFITLNHFNLIDDTPSASENLLGFIENRHDQALWTLLCFKYGVKTLSAYEYWYPKKSRSRKLEPDWKSLVNFPIHAKRDLDMGLFKNVILFFTTKIHKMNSLIKGLFK